MFIFLTFNTMNWLSDLKEQISEMIKSIIPEKKEIFTKFDDTNVGTKN